MKYLKLFILIFLSISLSTNLFSQQYHGKKKEINKILKNIEKFSQYYMNSDHEGLAACYTEKGKIFPDRQGIIEGKEGLERYWTVPKDVKILKHKVTPTEIRIVKKYAYDYGFYEGQTLRPNGETSSWKGKYVIVWRKVGKDWKIYLDIWNRVVEPKD